MQYQVKLAFWEYVDAELVPHVMEKQLEQPAMQQIIDAYVETSAHQLRIVRMRVRHAFQEHACVELVRRVREVGQLVMLLKL